MIYAFIHTNRKNVRLVATWNIKSSFKVNLVEMFNGFSELSTLNQIKFNDLIFVSSI